MTIIALASRVEHNEAAFVRALALKVPRHVLDTGWRHCELDLEGYFSTKHNGNRA